MEDLTDKENLPGPSSQANRRPSAPSSFYSDTSAVIQTEPLESNIIRMSVDAEEGEEDHHHHHHHHHHTQQEEEHHHHHHHHHKKPEEEVDPTLEINPSTGKPFVVTHSQYGNLINKVTMFLPGMQSMPKMFEHRMDEPFLAPLLPSLIIKRKNRHPSILIKGLQVLAFTEHLFIRSTYEVMPFFYDVPNRYEVLDTLGQRIYFATETEGFWTRHSARNCSPFKINILNFEGQEIFYFEGEPGCLQGAAEIRVFRNDELWGTVAQELNCCTPRYDILSAEQELLYIVYGPKGSACFGTNFGQVEFPIFLPDNRTVAGRYSASWHGAVREIYTTANNFGASFDKDLDVKLKAVLLGAAFLIYFQYFEKGGGQPNSRTLYGFSGRGYNRHGKFPFILSIAIPVLTLIIFGTIIYILAWLP